MSNETKGILLLITGMVVVAIPVIHSIFIKPDRRPMFLDSYRVIGFMGLGLMALGVAWLL